jgi:C_GCAxxG_C_C family probable redox protein
MEKRMDRVERAASFFEEGFSCSQSVCSAFCDDFGFSHEQALKVSSAFGGGMGHNDEMCGAVSGALMVVGMKHGRVRVDDTEAKMKCYDLAGECIRRFKATYDSVQCTDLLGCDLSSEEGLKRAREKNLFSTLCVSFVRDAALILEQIL